MKNDIKRTLNSGLGVLYLFIGIIALIGSCEAAVLGVDAYRINSNGQFGLSLSIEQSWGQITAKQKMDVLYAPHIPKFSPTNSYFETDMSYKLYSGNPNMTYELYFKHTCWHQFYYPYEKFERVPDQEVIGIRGELTI